MKCIAFLSFLLLSIIALGNAMPGNDGHGHSPHPSCLNQGQANHLLQTWISFFVKMDPKVAGKTLDPNFQFYSDSSNFLEFYGPKAIGEVTVSGRKAFIDAQVKMTSGSNGENPFQVLNFFYDCNHFVFRWRLPGSPYALTGLDLVTLKDGRIIKGESEFNSAIEYFNVGYCDLTKAGCVQAAQTG